MGLRPERNDEGVVTFRMAIQADNERTFTRKPRYLWAEIQPVSIGNQDSRTYYFFNRSFSPEWEVPIFEFPASDWPQSAKKGEITMWFLPPGARIETKSFKVPRLPSEQVESPYPGIQFRFEIAEGDLGSDRLIIFEEHDPRQTNPKNYPLYVDLGDADLKSLYHAYGRNEDSSKFTVRHEFTFADGELARANVDRLLEMHVALPTDIKNTGNGSIKVTRILSPELR